MLENQAVLNPIRTFSKTQLDGLRYVFIGLRDFPKGGGVPHSYAPMTSFWMGAGW